MSWEEKFNRAADKGDDFTNQSNSEELNNEYVLLKQATVGDTNTGQTYQARSLDRFTQYPISIAKKYGFSEKDIKEFNFITHVLKPWVVKTPNNCALWFSEGNKCTKLSYSELLLESQHLANALHHIGSPKCAIVILPKIYHWWTINIAGSFTGMIISPGATKMTEKELFYRLECYLADVIFCSSDLVEKFDEVTKHLPHRIVVEENGEDVKSVLKNGWTSYKELLQQGRHLPTIKPIKDGEAIVQVFFSSGTTGNPKMIPHTQVGFGIGIQESFRDIFRMTSADVIWNLSSLGWAKSTVTSFFFPIGAGSTIFHRQMSDIDPKLIIQTLNDVPVTIICCYPTVLRALMQEDLSSVRSSKLNRIFSGGESLNAELIKNFYSFTGVQIYDMYGQTETTILISNKPDEVQKTGSMGKASSDYDLVIVDDDYNELENNKSGQLAISTKKYWPFGLCKGYHNNIEKTKKSFVNGLYLSGDRVYRDDDGFFWFVGRFDDMITSSGLQVSPIEVESALLEHPAVRESAVVASPDSLRGQAVKAFIVLTDDYNDQAKDEEGRSNLKKEIQDFFKSTISVHIFPRKIEFVESLPRNIYGKIKRAELRNKEFLN